MAWSAEPRTGQCEVGLGGLSESLLVGLARDSPVVSAPSSQGWL